MQYWICFSFGYREFAGCCGDQQRFGNLGTVSMMATMDVFHGGRGCFSFLGVSDKLRCKFIVL